MVGKSVTSVRIDMALKHPNIQSSRIPRLVDPTSSANSSSVTSIGKYQEREKKDVPAVEKSEPPRIASDHENNAASPQPGFPRA